MKKILAALLFPALVVAMDSPKHWGRRKGNKYMQKVSVLRGSSENIMGSAEKYSEYVGRTSSPPIQNIAKSPDVKIHIQRKKKRINKWDKK